MTTPGHVEQSNTHPMQRLEALRARIEASGSEPTPGGVNEQNYAAVAPLLDGFLPQEKEFIRTSMEKQGMNASQALARLEQSFKLQPTFVARIAEIRNMLAQMAASITPGKQSKSNQEPPMAKAA